MLGEVVAVYIDELLIKDGVYQTAMGEPDFARGPRRRHDVEVTQDRMFDM